MIVPIILESGCKCCT